MAVMDGDAAPAGGSGLLARLRATLGDSSDASLTKRLAGTIFIIRVFSAALAYVSQILLARWMGSSEYGIYVYAWTWVLLLGSMMDFGIAVTAQKLIPEYRGKNQLNLLRGFLFGSRWMTFGVSVVTSCLLAGLVYLLSPWIDAAHGRAALYRLHDSARARARQRAGRHRPLARLDAAGADAAIHRAPVADHRLHRGRVRDRRQARAPIRR